MNIQEILSNLKIEQLNAMQQASLSAAGEGKDVILLSPTGTGKTLAYLLPLVQILKPGVEGVQAVVLVPSRELALQIEQVFKSMGTAFSVMSCYGGRPAMEEKPGVEGVQAVVLVPSRELALQIEQVFKSMGTAFSVMSCYGGRPAMEEHRTMKNIRPSVIIATPGRMNDHLNKQNFEASAVGTLVIDEFDKCLEFIFVLQ